MIVQRSVALGLVAVIGSAVATTAAPALVGTTWRVETVVGAGALESAKTSLVIQEDGRLATTVGCNRMAGRAKVEGSALTVGPIAATRMACAPALMAQEQVYGKALQATRSHRIDGQRLTFLDASGAILATFTAGP